MESLVVHPGGRGKYVAHWRHGYKRFKTENEVDAKKVFLAK